MKLWTTAAAATVLLTLTTGCEPGMSSRALVVSTSPNACELGGTADCYRGVTITVTGSGFSPGATVRVYVPAQDGFPRLRDYTIDGAAAVSGTGTISATAHRDACVVLPNPHEVPNAVAVVADDPNGLRLAFTFMPSRELVCQPPFQRHYYTQPCGEILCPTLTSDSATTIGVHWNHRDAGRDLYRIRYGIVDDEAHWTTTRDFGSDVGHVAINNLTPGVGYGFAMQACDSPLFGPDTCDPWLDVGEAATA